MKFKRILLVTVLLFAVFAMGAVSATDDNATNEVVKIENDDESIETVHSSEIATNNDEILRLNEKSNETTLTSNDNGDILLNLEDDDVLSDGNTKKLTVKPKKVYSNKKFTYSVKLTDNGYPVSGEKLELTIFDGEDYCTTYYATTNYNGIATFNMKAEPIGAYDISVDGDDVWEESYVKVIKDPKTKTTVRAPKVTARYKQNKYFKVTVKNYKGKPIKNLLLKLKVYTNNKYRYYKIKTNSKGIALFNTKKLKVGSHVVRVYSANKKYKISKKSKILIKGTRYVKVGRYIGKLTNNQYNYLVKAYIMNKNFAFVTLKCTNVKYHKITVEILTGYNPMNERYYKKGFYGNVWDTRYGIDGTKLQYAKVKFYAN